jgi:hypothetical protein
VKTGVAILELLQVDRLDAFLELLDVNTHKYMAKKHHH